MTGTFRRRKRVLKRLLDIIVLFALSLCVYWALSFFLSRTKLLNSPFFQLGVAVLTAAFFFKPVDHLVSLFFRHVLFRRQDHHFFALPKLTRQLMNFLVLQEISRLIVQTVAETMKLKSASLFIFQRQDRVYQMSGSFGLPEQSDPPIRLSVERPLIHLMLSFAKPLVSNDIRKQMPWQEANQLAHEFELLHAACLVPVIDEDRLIGFLNLGIPLLPHSLRTSDVHLLEEFAKNVAPVIRNAIVMEELRKANRDLKQVHSELIQATRSSAIEQLATGIAHEIHNPLTIISGKAQVLLLKKDKKGYDEHVEEVLKTIVKQTKRAADITRKLLMFSRARGTVREEIDFEQLANDTVALVSYQAELDEIRVIREVEAGLPVYYGNPSAFREIFLNLFLNAVHAVGKSGWIRVAVRFDKGSHSIEIRVADSGVGIREENLRRIFDPFFSTRPGATGLGLFVTQQIVRRCGGAIRVESKAGEGTSVIIHLPIESQEESNGPAAVDMPDNVQRGGVSGF